MLSPISKASFARVTSPEILPGSSQTIVKYRVEGDTFTEPELWFSIWNKYDHWISPRMDGALLALLIPAMRRNLNLYLDGIVTDTLLFNVNQDIQSLLRTLDPSLNHIVVTAREHEPADRPSQHIATGFSGGVDSFSTIGDYFLATNIPQNLRLTHLMYFNVGSHGPGGERLFRERWQRLAPTADRLGLPFIRVNSNLDDWFDRADDFPSTHVLRTLAASIVLSGGIGRYLHSSTYAWSVFQAMPDPFSSSRSEPMLVPLLSTGASVVQSVGSSRSRLERIKFVSTIKESYDSLDVCQSPLAAGNCSKCRKCLQTMLEMDLQDVLHLYESVFDVKRYRSNREAIIAHFWTRTRPQDRDIQTLIKEHHLEPSLLEVSRQKLLAAAKIFKRWVFR